MSFKAFCKSVLKNADTIKFNDIRDTEILIALPVTMRNMYESVDTKLQKFWWHLKEELNFRTLIYYNRDSCDCWSEEFLKEDDTSAVVLNQEIYPPYLKDSQDLDILVISCLRAAEYEGTLTALSILLNHMRHVPIMLNICEDGIILRETLTNLAGIILQRCFELHMPNVILTPSDFSTSDELFSYEAFPIFRLLSLSYQNVVQLFPYKINNLFGYNIRTYTDGMEPHTIAYHNDNGELVIKGMVWQLLLEFARNLNGTLKLVMEHTGTGSIAETLSFVQNNTMDIAASIRSIIKTNSRWQEYSYPLFIGSWCTMLPVERTLSSNEAMARVVESPWTYLYLLIIYVLHRRLAGYGIGRSRLFRLLLLLTHLFLACLLLAQLSALFIIPQQRNRIENLRQLNNSGLRIMGIRRESFFFPVEMKITYASSFLLEDNSKIFLDHRNAFNTSFGYTIPSDKWPMYNAQQEYFKRPLFRYSTNICVQKLSLGGLLLYENCLFRNELNAFIIRIDQTGLLQFWNRQALFYMIEANRLHLADLSTSPKAQAIHWNEWLHIAELYAIGLSISLMVFLLELTVHYINVFLDNL